MTHIDHRTRKSINAVTFVRSQQRSSRDSLPSFVSSWLCPWCSGSLFLSCPTGHSQSKICTSWKRGIHNRATLRVNVFSGRFAHHFDSYLLNASISFSVSSNSSRSAFFGAKTLSVRSKEEEVDQISLEMKTWTMDKKTANFSRQPILWQSWTLFLSLAVQFAFVWVLLIFK